MRVQDGLNTTARTTGGIGQLGWDTWGRTVRTWQMRLVGDSRPDRSPRRTGLPGRPGLDSKDRTAGKFAENIHFLWKIPDVCNFLRKNVCKWKFALCFSENLYLNPNLCENFRFSWKFCKIKSLHETKLCNLKNNFGKIFLLFAKVIKTIFVLTEWYHSL